MSTVPVPKVWTSGLSPKYFCNGYDVVSQSHSQLAAYVNMLAGRRRRVLYTRSARITTVAGGAGAIPAFYGEWRTSPTPGRVRMTLMTLPVSNTGATIDPYVQAQLSTDGTVYAARTALRFGHRDAGTVSPSQIGVAEQFWDDLDPDTTYYHYLSLNDYARVLAVTIWEEPLNQIDVTPATPTTDGCVFPDWYNTRSAITDASIDDLHTTAYDLWKKQGAVLASWGKGIAPTTLSASYVNAFDSTLTDWSAGGPGFWAYPRLRGSYHSTNVPIYFTAQASVSGGGTGTIALRTTTGADVATISVTSATAAEHTATGYLDSSRTSDLMQVLFKTTAGTLTLNRMSIYEYSP